LFTSKPFYFYYYQVVAAEKGYRLFELHGKNWSGGARGDVPGIQRSQKDQDARPGQSVGHLDIDDVPL
jgi:hypothetical protein